MPSSLEQLSDFVMLVSHKENQGKWLDVIALVEAARAVSTIANEVNYGISYGNSMSDALDGLTDALAKLDEVQP